MGPQQIRAAVELIAATHITECVPSASFVTTSGPSNSTSGLSSDTSGPSDSTSGPSVNASFQSNDSSNSSNSTSGPFVLTSASGGAPAMDKWARALLRMIIAKPEVSLARVFKGDKAMYVPARPRGRALARAIMRGTEKPDSEVERTLQELSDDE